MEASESVVCQNVDTISLDSVSNRLWALTSDGRLFSADSPQTTLDLSQAAIGIKQVKGKSESIEASDRLLWTSIGTHGGKIVAAAHN